MSNGDGNGNGKAWWTTLPALLGALAALITAGVGVAAFVAQDDGNADPPPDPPTLIGNGDSPTKESWAREANDVCARLRDEFSSLQAANPNANADPAQAVSFIEQAVSAAERASDDLGDIPAPPEWENDVGELISVIDQEVLTYRGALQAFRAGDMATAQQNFAQAQELVNRENSLWSKLDVRGCAA